MSNDKYWIFFTEYSRREVEELERLSGKSTLAGDLIRFHDALTELGRVIREAFAPIFKRLSR